MKLYILHGIAVILNSGNSYFNRWNKDGTIEKISKNNFHPKGCFAVRDIKTEWESMKQMFPAKTTNFVFVKHVINYSHLLVDY